ALQRTTPELRQYKSAVLAGWPFHSAIGFHNHFASLVARVPAPSSGTITLPPINGVQRVIPVRPIWPGMIGNVLVHGALVFFALTGVAVMHRVRRRRRGQCAWCAYDRAGIETKQPCPECGRAS
ncbi:MAG: hypothetical protein AAFV77_13750, partial [Planctomycetota bacterium]